VVLLGECDVYAQMQEPSDNNEIGKKGGGGGIKPPHFVPRFHSNIWGYAKKYDASLWGILDPPDMS